MALSFQNKIRPVQGAATSTPPVPGGSTTPTVSFSSKVRPISTPVASQPISTPQEDTGGGVGGFFKGLVSAPATMIARPFQAAADIGDYIGTKMAIADNPESEGAIRSANIDDRSKNRAKEGSIIAPTPQNTSDVIKDVGRGVQTVALGTGAPMAGGAAFGFGASLENQGSKVFTGEGATDALTSTLIGMGAGKALDLVGKPLLNAAGNVIGKITPQTLKDVSSRGATAVSSFMAQHEIVPTAVKPAINAIPKVAEAFDKGVNKLFSGTGGVIKGAFQEQYPGMKSKNIAKHYENVEVSRLFEPTKKTDAAYRNATEVFKDSKKRGINLEKIAADNKIYASDHITDGKYATQEVVDTLRNETMGGGPEILRPYLKAAEQGVARVPVSDVRNEMIYKIGKVSDSKLSTEQKKIAIQRINKEYGDGSVTSSRYKDGYGLENLYDSKLQTSSNLYKGPKNGGVQSISDNLTSQQKEIESQVFDSLLRKNAPKELGLDAYFKAQESKFVLANYLESLNTKKATQTMFQRGMKKAAQLGGATTGASVAGPFGMFSGYQFGGIVADTFASASNPVKVMYLKSIGKTQPEIYSIMKTFTSDAEARALSRQLLPAAGASGKTSPDLMRKQNMQGAVEMGYPQRPTTPGERFNNNNKQNLNQLFNTKTLPAPEPRIITPNTQGTPNRMSKLYNSGGDKGEVGGMRQRIKPKK